MTVSFNAEDPSKPTGQQADQGTFTANQQPDPVDENARKGEASDAAAELAKLQKRLDDSQNFIETLKKERAEDRAKFEEYEARLSQVKPLDLDEILEKVNQSKGDPTVDLEDLVTKVGSQLEQKTQAQKKAEAEQANFKQVADSLTAAFGSDTDAKVTELAAEMDMTFDEAVEIAKHSPKRFFKLFDVKPTEVPTPAVVPNTVPPRGPGQQPDSPSHVTATSEKERIRLFNEQMNKGLAKLNRR